MNTTLLQIPIKIKLRDQALKTAEKQGFSSLQEAVRVFLAHYAQEKVQISFSNPSIKLSAKNDARYAKMVKDVKSGKVKKLLY